MNSQPAFDPTQVPDTVRGICRRLRSAGHQGLVVGGSVRDILLGRVPGDFDIATSALPKAILDLFGSRYAIPTGLAHGTVTVLVGEGSEKRAVEVTTFRGDGTYLDGRHPESVRFGVTLLEDLSRRDFTMNALAWDPMSEELFDPFAGRSDIEKRIVRTVGNPMDRFSEDGLRPMRAIRQATQLGFTIFPETLAAIEPTLPSFRKVAVERIRDEFKKLLLADGPSRGLELLRQTHLLDEILPELVATVGVVQNRFHPHDVYHHILATVDAAVPDWIVRMAAVLHDLGKPRTQAPREGSPGEYTFFGHERVGTGMAAIIGDRLRLPSAEKELLCALVAGHMFYYTPDWTDGTVRRFVRRIGVERLAPLFALREADVMSRGGDQARDCETRPLQSRIELLKARDAALSTRDLAMDGNDVMRILGEPPSRRIGAILNQLLECVLDHPEWNHKDRLEPLVREIAAIQPAEDASFPSGNNPQAKLP